MNEPVDRFTLESKITDTYNFVTHINDLSDSVLNGNLSEDEISNALNGLAILLKCHTDKLFEVFTQALKLDGYNEI
jgi:putative lipase involved disintegration of autophagic bodies